MFRDIAKVFNSVSVKGLELALQRIVVPQSIIKLIINLFQGRKAQILTSFGLTPSFEAVDQGDSLSLVLWRIYYDPLLNAITKRHQTNHKEFGQLLLQHDGYSNQCLKV
uniref:Reverse transcriptase domain-containing protein n=1 Tax=Rhizophagus irregularis (strain DAOM 181602 / DAOM 197198 / MUCL 43194) TaxID=747089 RepID=U9SWS9_RHIID